MTTRDKRVGEWFFRDTLGHKGLLPTRNSALIYMKALLNLAAADGILHEDERKWVLGFASTVGKSIS